MRASEHCRHPFRGPIDIEGRRDDGGTQPPGERNRTRRLRWRLCQAPPGFV